MLLPLDFFGLDDERVSRLLSQLNREQRLVQEQPRFDGWGDGESIDAVYCLGSLLYALRSGDQERFSAGLDALASAAMDPQLHGFREVSPIQREGTASPLPSCWLPGRRLDRSEPCLGALGVLLVLLRAAFVTEMPAADGRLGSELLLLGGVPTSWWERGELMLQDVPTLSGRVSVSARMGDGLRLTVSAPEATAVVVRTPSGELRRLEGGTHEVVL